MFKEGVRELIMKYAPIIIPTLNRYEHLHRCIESLRQNAGAKDTSLIISVDYPPNDKYKEGREKICQYLEAGIVGFQDVTILYQEKNLGSIGNAKCLESYVSEKYAAYIFSEDDNEFAPNFLEYINKGLERYEEDDSIIAVCGSGIGAKPEDDLNNIFKTHIYGAYGVGIWVKKKKYIEEKMNWDYLREICKRTRRLYDLFQEDISLVFALQDALVKRRKIFYSENGELALIDMTYKIYTYTEDKYVISPYVPKVRNWGYDGSGSNCDDMQHGQFKMPSLDTEISFEYQQQSDLQIRDVEHNYTFNDYIRFFCAYLRLKKYLFCRKR